MSRLILDTLIEAVSPFGLTDDEAIHALALSEATAHPSTPAITNIPETRETPGTAKTAGAAETSGGRS